VRRGRGRGFEVREPLFLHGQAGEVDGHAKSTCIACKERVADSWCSELRERGTFRDKEVIKELPLTETLDPHVPPKGEKYQGSRQLCPSRPSYRS